MTDCERRPEASAVSSLSIAFVQPIFAPTAAQAERNLASVRSLIEYIRAYRPTQLTLLFGGWGEEPFLSDIIDLIELSFGDRALPIVRYTQNFGKAVIVNDLVSKLNGFSIKPDVLFLIGFRYSIFARPTGYFSAFKVFIFGNTRSCGETIWGGRLGSRWRLRPSS